MSEKTLGLMMAGLMTVSATGLAGEIRVRAVSLSPGYPAGEVMAQDADGKETSAKIEVKSFLNHESQTINFESRALVFSNGDEEENTLGSIDVPASLKSGILVFRPGLKDEAPEVIITNDSASVFPAGSTKVVNLAADPMKIELEGKGYECEAGGELVIKDPPVKPNNSSGMRAFRKKGNEWVKVKSGVWPHPGKKRVLKVITINPITKQVVIHGLRDISDPAD